MLSVLLARHGQSVWNAAGRWQGQSDPPLSELGQNQAREAALRAGSFDAIVASDLERATHTAAIISEATGVGPVLIEARLKERHAGEFEGLTRDEIELQFPGHLAAEKFPPGWEPDAQLLKRTLGALASIVGLSGASGEVLVVTHGGVIYALEASHGLPYQRIANLSGRWLHHVSGGSDEQGADHQWRLGERVQLAPDEPAGAAHDIL